MTAASRTADATADRPPPDGPPEATATPRTPAASNAKPIAKTGPAPIRPDGMGRSGRSRASLSRSNASFRYMPPV